MQKKDLKLNKKRRVHIVFAMFMFLLSFGISLSSISAVHYWEQTDENDKLNQEYLDEAISSGKYIIKTSTKNSNTDKYRHDYFIFESVPTGYVRADVTDMFYFTDDAGKIITPVHLRYFEYDSNYNSFGGSHEENHWGDFNYYPDTFLYLSTIKSINFDLVDYKTGDIVFQGPPVVSSALEGVDLIPTLIIIAGSTICLVGLVIGLRVLVRGLRQVLAQS